MVNRMTGSVTCNRCTMVKRAQIYHCNNRGRFFYNGRSLQHNNGYVICADCWHSQFKQARDEENKENAMKNDTQKYTTNPFIESCIFMKVKTIKQLLHRIENVNDKKNILIKLLLSKNKYGNIALWYVTKHNNVQMS
eukprot:510524_1